VYAIDHRITVTRVPAACQGLSKAQINEAAASAINMVVGGRSKKPAWRRLTAEAAPRLAYLITGPQPAPGSPPQASQPAGGTPVRAGTGSDLALRLAALGAWLITAGSGAYLLVSWIIRSGIRRRRPRTPRAGTPPVVLLGHFGLATTGLLVWVIYLIADWAPLAWAAVGLLLPPWRRSGSPAAQFPTARPPAVSPPGRGRPQRRPAAGCAPCSSPAMACSPPPLCSWPCWPRSAPVRADIPRPSPVRSGLAVLPGELGRVLLKGAGGPFWPMVARRTMTSAPSVTV
jgi:hypothetical protein